MLHLEKCREFGFQLRCPSIISLVTGLRVITSYEESETLFLAFLLMLVLYCTRNPEVLFLTTGVPGKRAKINIKRLSKQPERWSCWCTLDQWWSNRLHIYKMKKIEAETGTT